MGTYASRSAVLGTGSIRESAGEVRDRLLRLAGTLLEAGHEDLELRDGQAGVKGVPSRSVPIGQVSIFGYFGGEARPPEVQRSGLTATAGYNPGETYANGCAAAVVEVDVETGSVTVEQIVAVEDCGVVLNPMIVKGQVAGAVAQGVGIALLEDLVYEEDGEFVSGSLLHYLYPTTTEIPMMDLHTIETPSACQRRRGQGGRRGGHDLDAGRDRQRDHGCHQPVRRDDRPRAGDAPVPPRAAPGGGGRRGPVARAGREPVSATTARRRARRARPRGRARASAPPRDRRHAPRAPG